MQNARPLALVYHAWIMTVFQCNFKIQTQILLTFSFGFFFLFWNFLFSLTLCIWFLFFVCCLFFLQMAHGRICIAWHIKICETNRRTYAGMCLIQKQITTKPGKMRHISGLSCVIWIKFVTKSHGNSLELERKRASVQIVIQSTKSVAGLCLCWVRERSRFNKTKPECGNKRSN